MMRIMSTGKYDDGRHQLDTWQIMLFAIFAGLLTVAIAYATWWDAGVPVSEFPAWLGAWATVAAVVAAIVAGFYASRAFGLELDRQRRADTDRRAAQASRVAAWPLKLIYDRTIETDDEGLSHGVNVGVRGVIVRVRNASDLPIAQVRVVASAMVRGSSGRTEEVPISTRTERHLDPESTTDLTLLAGAPDALTPLVDQIDPEVRIFLQFTDVIGRSWSRRTHEGEIHDGGTKAERTTIVGPRRWWHRWWVPSEPKGLRWRGSNRRGTAQ
jgi:hypothetical protein